jgi:hypothetical protein
VDAVEAFLARILEPDEELEARAEGIIGPWLPLGFLGELLARPVVVALTDRRVFLLETRLFSNRVDAVELIARRDAVSAEIERRRGLGWSPVQGRWSRLTLRLPDETIRVYVDGAARRDADAIAARLAASVRSRG